MAGAIGKGDWVECINDGGMPQVVRIGAIYLVERVGDAPKSGVPCLMLRGVCHPTVRTDSGRWVRAEYFRPIYRPKPELLESLLRKADEPLKVDA